MSSEQFTGTVSQMRIKSNWLASEDLLGMGEIKVEIEAVYKHENVKMDGGRTEPILFSVKFKKQPKEMILNSTNRKVLSGAFGAKTTDWIGKTVFIRAQDGIRKPGTKNETCYGLRLRADESQLKPNFE